MHKTNRKNNLPGSFNMLKTSLYKRYIYKIYKNKPRTETVDIYTFYACFLFFLLATYFCYQLNQLCMTRILLTKQHFLKKVKLSLDF